MVPLALNPGLVIKPHPGAMEPFLAKVADLVCSVFGDDCARDFKWEDGGQSGMFILRGDLDDQYKVKISINDHAAVAIFYRRDSSPQRVEELDRSALRNSSWSDFQGWIYKVKTEYDRISTEGQLFHVVKTFGIYDEPSQTSVRFKKGDRVQVAGYGHGRRIRLHFGSDRGPWITPSKSDSISNIPRMIRLGCLRPISE